VGRGELQPETITARCKPIKKKSTKLKWVDLMRGDRFAWAAVGNLTDTVGVRLKLIYCRIERARGQNRLGLECRGAVTVKAYLRPGGVQSTVVTGSSRREKNDDLAPEGLWDREQTDRTLMKREEIEYPRDDH